MDELLILDLGEDAWRCGWASDSGPEVIVPPPAQPNDAHAIKQHLNDVFSELGATPSSSAVLLSEPPGAPEGSRDAIAKILFGEFGVPMLWSVSAPLLALFNVGRDTITLVDVGAAHAHILLVYEGHPVLDAATDHALHGSGGSSGSGSTGAGTSAAVAATATTSASSLCDAILSTIHLADITLRAELLANVVLVGNGSKGADFVEGVRTGLAKALAAYKDSSGGIAGAQMLARRRRRHRGGGGGGAYRGGVGVGGSGGGGGDGDVGSGGDAYAAALRISASPDRIIAAWLGGQMVVAMESAQARFVGRAQHAAVEGGRWVLHTRCIGLACRTLDEQKRHHVAAARAELEADAARRREEGAHARRLSEEARKARLAESRAAPPADAAAAAARRAFLRHIVTAASWYAWSVAMGASQPSRTARPWVRRRLTPGADVTVLSRWLMPPPPGRGGMLRPIGGGLSNRHGRGSGDPKDTEGSSAAGYAAALVLPVVTNCAAGCLLDSADRGGEASAAEAAEEAARRLEAAIKERPINTRLGKGDSASAA